LFGRHMVMKIESFLPFSEYRIISLLKMKI
jgi:hypothetical protein